MMYVPKFQYPATSGTVLTLSYSMRHWARRQATIGGQREAASGVAAARTIRRDYLLDVVLRIDESELASVETMIAWMQDNPRTAFTFWPDKDVAGTSFSAYLISPIQGEDFAPFRSSEIGNVLESTLTMRRSNNTSWGAVWYPD